MLAATEAADPQWYALHVHPQREYEVAYRLRRLGYSTFIPTELRTHKRASYAKGKTQFAVPLIPGCIFVGFPTDPAWLFVLSDPRIVAPYGMDDKPWRMDFVKLFKFMNKSLDGCLVIGDGLPYGLCARYREGPLAHDPRQDRERQEAATPGEEAAGAPRQNSRFPFPVRSRRNGITIPLALFTKSRLYVDPGRSS